MNENQNAIEDLDQKRACVGIDLGTTNTSAAYSYLGEDGIVHLEDLKIAQKGCGSQSSSPILPSILYRINENNDVVGHEALDLRNNNIIGSVDDIRYIENTKRYIGTTTTFTIGDKKYSPIYVAASLLKHIKKFSQINKIKDYYTVITVPANFNFDQRTDTLEAARLAGFKDVHLYDEPKAAIISFLHDESVNRESKLLEFSSLDVSEKRRILVIDIGGGTCDICVEDVVEEEGTYIFEHLAVGRENLGGVDFDKLIGEQLAKKHLKSIKLNSAEIASLRNIGQNIKETLSSEIAYFIDEKHNGDQSQLYENANWLGILENEHIKCEISKTIGGEQIDFSMSLREFVDSIKPLIYPNDNIATNKDERDRNKNMGSLIATTLKDKDIDVNTIDLIFLTGGMANCFPLKAALYDIYHKPIITPSEPFLAVSRGAALYNKYKCIDAISKDLLANGIMIEMNDGHLKTLVGKGEQVPVTKTVDETFKTSSRNGVIISLYEGENEFDSSLRKINNQYCIEFDNPLEIGREFKIEYSIDKAKTISFKIKFLDNGDTWLINGKLREGK